MSANLACVPIFFLASIGFHRVSEVLFVSPSPSVFTPGAQQVFIAEFGECSLFKSSLEFLYSFLRKFALALEYRSQMGHNEIKNVKRHAGWGNRKFVLSEKQMTVYPQN